MPVLVPPNDGVMGAIGAALLAREHAARQRGPDAVSGL
jgi:activator of 2-hydroxyglutaryl-CoA dehydratase